MSTQVTHYLNEAPVFDHAWGKKIRLGDDLTIHYLHDAGPILRQFAADLMGAADLLDHEHLRGQHALTTAREQIAKLRRERGDIGADGICLDCAIGDHDGHKPYNEGRCYGCSCSVEIREDA